MKSIVAAKLKGNPLMDDKTMLMEKTIQLVTAFPNHSLRQEILTNVFIDQLWNSLKHPPLLYMGDQFRYRQPDGSNNNPLMPKLGAAGTPYSRTMKPGAANLAALPDPELIFEAVMARTSFKKNPNNVSSFLWYWATIIIHDIFWTDPQDMNINKSSSYIDLAPLYGNSKESADSVRAFKNGLLKPDSFADKRLLATPPGVCVILIMFNRFHNHVAQGLAAINEGNRFPRPSADLLGEEAAAAAWKKYDEDLYQTARLVTSGLYANITLVDYVRNIINLNRIDSDWTLDPRQEMGVSVGTLEGAESGVGNVVSAEFNLCYRWHSCISEMDDKWIQGFFKKVVGDVEGEVDAKTFFTAAQKLFHTIPDDPLERTFGGFERGPDGRFNDDELVECLTTAIEQPGGAFGARNVPRSMKLTEILGIIRGREWKLAGLNQFRKHFGLKAYETFEEINSDPDVADQLRNLYQHPDYVELYPGIVAEEAKQPMVPGVGIGPTYTISRVVLSDAVSLIRGDRHYTTDYHPGYLTQWGFNEAKYDVQLNHGCLFYKLIVRAFPLHFSGNSVYAHFPMVTPPETRLILTRLGQEAKFDFDRPQRRQPMARVMSRGGVEHVLGSDKYSLNLQKQLQRLMGEDYCGGPLLERARRQKLLESVLYCDGWKASLKAFYAATARRLLEEKSHRIAGKMYCDVVRDYGNLAHIRLVARMFNLPLKYEANPKGVFSEHELYDALTVIHSAVLLDLDPCQRLLHQERAKELAGRLGKVIELNIKLSSHLGMAGLFTGRAGKDSMVQYGVKLIQSLARQLSEARTVAWGVILPALVSAVPMEAQVFAQAVDWYLSGGGQHQAAEIERIASQESNADSDGLLLGYAMEGIRMTGPPGLSLEAAAADVVLEDDGTEVRVEAGERLLVSFAQIARGEAPTAPPPPLESCLYPGAGTEMGLGKSIGQTALVELFRALFRKKGLRRVGGAQGELRRLAGWGGDPGYLSEDGGHAGAFASSLKVFWDVEG